jgi:hypothetical protein
MFVYSHPEVDHSRIHRGSVGPDNLLSLAGVGHCYSVRDVFSLFVCLSSVFVSLCPDHKKVDHSWFHIGSIGPDNLLSLAGFGHCHLVRVVLSVCLSVFKYILFVFMSLS